MKKKVVCLLTFIMHCQHYFWQMGKQLINEPLHAKACWSFANDMGGDQPAHLDSLISVFVFHSLDSIIPINAIPKVPRLRLASVDEQAGLSVSWLQISEDRFSHDMAHTY